MRRPQPFLPDEAEQHSGVGPKYPPTCAICGDALRLSSSGRAVSFDHCPKHPNGRTVYRLQAPRDGYPAGWPICAEPRCSKPALDGHATCGDAACNEARFR